MVRYSDGSAQLVCTIGPIVPSAGRRDDRKLSEAEQEARQTENAERAMRRARTEIQRLARENPLEWFVTLTLDPAKVERYDPLEMWKKVGKWLENAVQRYDLRYILVPELHPTSGGIHFHGFVEGDLRPSESGHRDKQGREIYNLTRWPFGFTAAVRIDGDRRAICGYICKYITKDGRKIGGRYYYHGGALNRPAVVGLWVPWDDVLALGGHEYQVPGVGRPYASLDMSPELVRGVSHMWGLDGFVDTSRALGIQFCDSRLFASDGLRGGFALPDGWDGENKREEAERGHENGLFAE